MMTTDLIAGSIQFRYYSLIAHFAKGIVGISMLFVINLFLKNKEIKWSLFTSLYEQMSNHLMVSLFSYKMRLVYERELI